MSPGPGEYNIEKATKITKNRSMAVNLSSVKGRNYTKIDPNNGPGTYDLKSSFGEDLNKITFGKRNDIKTE